MKMFLTRFGENCHMVVAGDPSQTDLPEDKTLIANGELAGKTLAEVIEKYSNEITGPGYSPGPFPLLIKLLDAQDVLSLQVHPDEHACRRLGEGEPKTECWYIV